MIRKKLLTAYCLSYGNWTVIPRQWAKSFGEMSDLGFDAVALSFSESEMRYARRTFEMQIAAAHQAGIKVFVIPSRIGGRLAGAPLMGSLWLHENPSACLPENPGIACIESPEFREWSLEFIRTLIRDYEVDGIIWDEPKAADFVTRHPAAVAALGEGYGKEHICRAADTPGTDCLNLQYAPYQSSIYRFVRRTSRNRLCRVRRRIVFAELLS